MVRIGTCASCSPCRVCCRRRCGCRWRSLRSTAGSPVPHGDGWGIAYTFDGDVSLVKETVAACDSDTLRHLQDRPPVSTAVISHIRKATQGERRLANCQPITRELGGRRHVFAHNGHLDPEQLRAALLLGAFRPVGTTDSEHAFCALLEQLRPLWRDCAGVPPLEDRQRIVADFAATLRPMGPANFVYCDGDVTFVHGHRRTQPGGGIAPPGLHQLSRSCRLPHDGLHMRGLSIQSSSDGGPADQRVVLVASVPLTDEDWTPLEDGELLVLRDGDVLARELADKRQHRERTLVHAVREGIIGTHHEMDGPFGPRLVTYADYTASGRSLAFIEDFLREHVMPYYANTHTESSGTGLQTTRFREDAREQILRSLGGSDEDAIIFTGSGATSAIVQLVDILNLRLPADLSDRYGLDERIPPEARPVVFIGPYEHHSNELPWRESIADVVVIDEDENGRPDLALLTQALERYRDRPLRIGSFSAASNVTGIGSKTREISSILHRHGALSFWDFAAAGPYVQIDLGPTEAGGDDYKDAVFLSPHKFIGGPGTPGILAVKRAIVVNRVPTVPGGGTVAYVGPTEHRYLDDVAHREEGGTPDILGAIRAGLVFQLKEAIGADAIREREDSFIQRAIRAVERSSQHPNPRQPGSVAAIDRVVHGAIRRPLPASQLRRVAAQRSARHPGSRRLLLCGSLWSSPARDRSGPLAGIPARNSARLRGHQTRLDPDQLQLLHHRRDLSVHPRWRGLHRQRGLEVPAAVSLFC